MMKSLHLGMRKHTLQHIIFSLAIGVAALSNSAHAASKPVTILPDAPDVYVVKKGDTLWDISRKFTKENWRWPELWGINRSKVRNPHLIYPGQRIVLDRNARRLALDEKVKPLVYVGPADDALSTVPRHLIDPFLMHPTIVDRNYLEGAGTVIANDYKQMNASKGDEIFAKSLNSDANSFEIFRPLRPVKDPQTNEILAYEGTYVGSAEVIERTNPVTLRLTTSKMETNVGDRLLPSRKPDIFAFAPHAPEKNIKARIIGTADHGDEAAQLSTIVINAGSDQGLDEGTILALYRVRGDAEFVDTTSIFTNPLAVDLKPHQDNPLELENSTTENHTLPSRRSGLAMVYQTSRKISYAIIMESESSLKIGDEVRNP